MLAWTSDTTREMTDGQYFQVSRCSLSSGIAAGRVWCPAERELAQSWVRSRQNSNGHRFPLRPHTQEPLPFVTELPSICPVAAPKLSDCQMSEGSPDPVPCNSVSNSNDWHRQAGGWGDGHRAHRPIYSASKHVFKLTCWPNISRYSDFRRKAGISDLYIKVADTKILASN